MGGYVLNCFSIIASLTIAKYVMPLNQTQKRFAGMFMKVIFGTDKC